MLSLILFGLALPVLLFIIAMVIGLSLINARSAAGRSDDIPPGGWPVLPPRCPPALGREP